MIPDEKLDRLINTVHLFHEQLSNCKSIAVHKQVNQSYYLQKEAELVILKEQRAEATNRLDSIQARIDAHYTEIYYTWRKDVRWINQYMLNERMKNEE